MEKQIWEATKKKGVFGCFEVTIGWYGKERVDYITYDTKGIWRCYEIKVSKSDFYNGAKPTFIGYYNYYVLPKEIYEQVKDDIPKHIGAYVGGINVKRARRQELGVDEQILKDSIIRSLYREYRRIIDSGNPAIVGVLRKRADRYKRQADNEYRKRIEIEKEFGYNEYK